MKNLIILLNISIILGVVSILSVEHLSENTGTKNGDLVESNNHLVTDVGLDAKITERSSEFTAIPANPSLDAEISDFIYEASESRIMDIEQGKIAEQRCTSRTLKDYGTLMVEDQNRMLEELKELAAKKGLVITTSLSEKKSSALNDLKERHGKDFDKKFVRMITIDHKRDVKKFEDALLSTDPDIQVFATKYLPLVKTHLDMIRSIRKN